MISSQSVSEIPYRLLHDIEDNSSDSTNSNTIIIVDRNEPNIEGVEIKMNTFLFAESKWAWYLFFAVWILVLIGCVLYVVI
jgi:hypothetical protein